MAAAAGGAQSLRHSGSSNSGSVKQVSTPVLQKLAKLEGQLMQVEAHQPWIKTSQADSVFGIVIFLNAGFMGIDVEYNTSEFSWGFWTAETVFLVIFGIELILRIKAEHPYYWRFCDAWGIFDTLVTLMGMLDTWVFAMAMSGDDNPLSSFTILRMFRLVRLVRLIRVLRMFNELVILVQTIGNSIKAVAWMSLLLGMIVYTGSVLTVMLIGIPYRDSDEDVNTHFGSLGSALFAHFCVVTLEAWPDIAAASIKHNRLWAVYWVFMIVLTNFLLVNLMVGVIVERIIHVSTEQENELASFVAESEQFRNTLKALFDSADLDLSGSVSRKEIRHLLNDDRTHEIMSAFGINLNIPPDTLHTIMDIKDDEPTTFEEFYHACMRLCGSKSSIHSVFVQGDICGVQKELTKRLGKIEKDIQRLAVLPRQPVLRAVPPEPVSSSSAFSATAAAEPPERRGAAASPEAVLAALVEKMDRFGQVQQNIYAEVHSLRDQAKMQREVKQQREPSRGQGDGAAAAAPSLADLGPELLQKAGQELGACCIDSIFSHRRALAVPVANTGAPSDLRMKTRRELEAEFRTKRGPLPRR